MIDIVYKVGWKCAGIEDIKDFTFYKKIRHALTHADSNLLNRTLVKDIYNTFYDPNVFSGKNILFLWEYDISNLVSYLVEILGVYFSRVYFSEHQFDDFYKDSNKQKGIATSVRHMKESLVTYISKGHFDKTVDLFSLREQLHVLNIISMTHINNAPKYKIISRIMNYLTVFLDFGETIHLGHTKTILSWIDRLIIEFMYRDRFKWKIVN